MYIVERYNTKTRKWEVIKDTLTESKQKTEELVESLNSTISKETIRLTPVKSMFRVKKVKKNEI